MHLTRRFVLTAGSAGAASAAGAALLAGCASLEKVTGWVKSEPWRPEDSGARLKAILDDLAVAMLKESPERATSLAVSEAQAGGHFNDRLSNASPAGMQRRAMVMANTLAELDRVDRSALNPADLVSYQVVRESLSNALAGARFGWGSYGFGAPTPYVVTQLSGSYVNVPTFLDTHHLIKTQRDVGDYLERLSAFAKLLDQETARINADAGKGVVPPDFVLDGALKQLRGFAAKTAAETVLVQSLKRRIGEAEGVDAPHANKAVANATKLVAEKVLAAYRRQIDAIAALKPKAVHEGGIWRLKDGDQFYATALRAWTTSPLSPDEIHKMGLDLVSSVGAQMDGILKANGLTKGTLAERITKISSDPKQLYPNTEAGRAQLLKDLNVQIEALQPLLAQYFGTLAKAKLEIRRVPAYREAGAPGGYYESGALDGSRPGYYYINLRDTKEWPKFSLPTLSYHEGEPGHHWQISIAQEAADLPLVRKALVSNSGYTEGWALYAEALADEMGAYAGNPLGRLGYLQSAAFRAARLVVDTGLHAKRWSREQAIDYMVEATGDQKSSVTTEIERYCVWPGQACAYMVGRETIRRARAEAQAALGEKFNIKAFHDLILKNGPVPLAVLSASVKGWVSAQLAPPSGKGN
jgi:uncharacterized protein (DUF885 family)